jgi:hypothetical protein
VGVGLTAAVGTAAGRTAPPRRPASLS